MKSFAAETATAAVEHRFEGEIQGYVANFLGRHFWRVRHTMDYEDAMQEAGIVFVKVSRKYPTVEPKHFMALFKTSWTRHFTDLTNADTLRREVIVESIEFATHENWINEDDEEVPLTAWNPMSAIGETDNGGMLKIMVKQAPREVRAVLALFVNAPGELLEAAVATWSTDKRRTGNPSAGICRMLGLDPSIDVMEETRRYFS